MRRNASVLDRDPDERTVRWGWVFWWSWLLVGGALAVGDWRSGTLGLGAVLAAPFWALWVLWLLYRAARFGLRHMRHAPLAAWDGQYYTFDDRQIRIVFDGDAIWFAADDVYDALGTPPASRAPERVRQVVGRDGLQAAPGAQLLAFSEKGLSAWLDRRTERRAVQFARWVQTQVIAPYRRRRELEGGGPP
jgi:hypothetical protein